jgi:hypothetical protein
MRWIKWSLIGGVLLAFAMWLFSPMGYLTLQRQCQIDGGLTISRAVSARGVQVDNRAGGNCEFCLSLVLSRAVDFAVFESNGYRSSGRQDEAGYYRMSLGREGDLACGGWKSPQLGAHECLAVMRLPSAPKDGYVLHRSSYADVPQLPTPKGAYAKTEYVLMDVASGDLIASYRQYRYFLPISRFLRDPSNKYVCPKQMTVEDFLRTTLNSKKN